MKTENDIIDKIIEQMKNHEVPVDSSLFNSISSSILKQNLFKNLLFNNYKWLLIGSSSIAIATITYFSINNSKEANYINKNKSKIEISSNNKINVNKNIFIDNNNENIEIKNVSKIKKSEKIVVKSTDVNVNNSIINNTTEILSVISNTTSDNNIVKLPNNFAKPSLTKIEKLLSEDKDLNLVQNEKSSNEIIDNKNVGRFPNIFSPNNDGNNDFFEIEWSCEVKQFSISILDINNKIVFQSQDPYFKWDGTNYDNSKVPIGRYIYFISANNDKGINISKSSYLQVVY